MQDYLCLNSAQRGGAVCGMYNGRLCKVECKMGNKIDTDGTNDREVNERLL